MSEIGTFCGVIDLWPSKEAMASEIGANASAVSKWWQRDSIPAEWWSAIISTAVACDAGVTPALLTNLAAREPAEDRV